MAKFKITLRRVEECTVEIEASTAAEVRRMQGTDEGQDTLSEWAMRGNPEGVEYKVLKVEAVCAN